MALQRIEELGPFGRAAGIGHVTGDQHGIERLPGMDRRQPLQHQAEPVIAARTGAPALDAEAVTLADDMDVGEMRHAPLPAGCARFVKAREIARLVHHGVGHAPGQRSRCKKAAHDERGIGQGRHDETQGLREVGDLAGPARRRPDRRRDATREERRSQTGRERRQRPQPCPAVLAGIDREKALGQMAQTLASQHIAGLDGKRVQRPEAALDRAEKRPPSEPADGADGQEEQERPDARKRHDPAGDIAEPGGDDERRDAQKDTRHQGEDDPGQGELGQVDLTQEGARDGDERMRLRAAGVVFGIAAARFNQHRQGAVARIPIRDRRFPREKTGVSKRLTGTIHAT